MRRKTDQKKFYDSIDPRYLQAEKNIPYARYIVSHVVPCVKRTDRVLEIGAGQGRFTFELARHCTRVVASDISAGEIALLKKQLPEKTNISAEVLDVSRPMPGKQMYDAVCGFFVLHHVPDEVEKVAETFSKHLAQGGRMVFVENNPTSPWHVLAILIRRDMTWEIEKGTYTNYIGRYMRACKKNGMRVFVKKKFGFFPPEIINTYPWCVKLHTIIEALPGVRDIFCPFIRVVVQKA